MGDSAGVHVNGIGNYGFCSNDCNQCKDSQLTLQLDNGPSCKRCQLCNEQGTVNGGQCNEKTGQCICKNGFTGEKCYVCSPGKYGISCNYDCDCDKDLSDGMICHQITGQCACVSGW